MDPAPPPPAEVDHADRPAQAIPVYVINLDRRRDRRAFMEDQLTALGLTWHRFPAIDAETVTDAEIAAEAALDGHLIRMGRGSQCCALSNFHIFRQLVASPDPAALILQDDSVLSPALPAFLRTASWIPEGIGLIQLEKWSRRQTRKLLGPPLATPAPGFAVRRLYSRTGGAGCYMITRAAAAYLLTHKPQLRFPIDHFLFNLNISPLARKVRVAMVTPALGRQAWGQLSSDISPGTRARRKSLRDRAARTWYEVNLIPAQAWAVLVHGARFCPVTFADQAGPGGTGPEAA